MGYAREADGLNQKSSGPCGWHDLARCHDQHSAATTRGDERCLSGFISHCCERKRAIQFVTRWRFCCCFFMVLFDFPALLQGKLLRFDLIRNESLLTCSIQSSMAILAKNQSNKIIT
jgi:hypothetical protein